MWRNRLDSICRRCIRELLRIRCIFLLISDGTHINHAAEYRLLALLGLFWVTADWRVSSWRWQHANEHSALSQRKVLWCFTKVNLGCLLDAERVFTIVHRVEIHLEDLVLRIILLDRERYEQLLIFTHKGLLACEDGVLGELLRNGRATTMALEGCPEDTDQAKPRVFIEVFILTSQ